LHNFHIVPYVTFDGVPTFRDSDIMAFYDRMASEGSADVVFSDGSVSNAAHFLQEMRHHGCWLIVIYYKDEPLGLMWSNRYQDSFAQNHFCCFKKFWGTPQIAQAGRLGSLWMIERLKVPVLLGLVPKSNPAAVDAVVRAGGKVIGELPDGHTSLVTGIREPLIILSYQKEGNEDEDIQ